MFGTTLLNTLWVGLLAGILATLVRIGFQQLFKLEGDKRSEALTIGGGVFVDISQMMMLVLSILLSIVFLVWANVDTGITAGSGTLWGFLVWVMIEQIYRGIFEKRGFFWQNPWQQTLVSFISYLFWGWAIYLVAIGFPISGVYF